MPTPSIPTPEQIDELLEAAKKATPRPWEWMHEDQAMHCPETRGRDDDEGEFWTGEFCPLDEPTGKFIALAANYAEGLAVLVGELRKVLRAADAETKAEMVRDASRRYDGGSGHGRSVGHDETVSLHEAAKGRREAIDGFRSGPCGVWLEESDKKR